MSAIGWFLFLGILVIRLRTRDIQLGLWSGLALCFLTFVRYMRPTPPPTDLLIVQASWFLFIATLDAVGFFHTMTRLLTWFVEGTSRYSQILAPLASYFCVFLTGNKRVGLGLYPKLWEIAERQKKSPVSLLTPVRLAMHLAALASPCSLSGIVLLLGATRYGFSFLSVVGLLTVFTVGFVLVSLCAIRLLPDTLHKLLLLQWVRRKETWAMEPNPNIPQKDSRYILVYALLLIVGLVFVCIKPSPNMDLHMKDTVFYFDLNLPLRLPLFVSLLLLSISAIVLLCFQVAPIQIVQTPLFTRGVAQFFTFFGLVWFVETLISHDLACLLHLRDSVHVSESLCFYGLSFLCMLFLEAPLVGWLGMPLWVGGALPLSWVALGWTLCTSWIVFFFLPRLVYRRSG
ncbi:MAG TPA: anaerobic C4-dicarboxylate transporter family protein [Amoebophilaceae bacterium]|jgi:anaerobic C4-dicarboxylate transporter DcuB|nr:anaerobic C4-dicarboxylate transporter family protein [Amoebophilaceae bacterium]